MKLLTKLKLRLEGILKSVNLDWREVAIELMNDLIEEQKSHFACKLENHDLKQQLAVYKEKEQMGE
jgi:hypothetical protein